MGQASQVLCIIDGHAGLRRAVGLVWPRAAVQRCCVHKLRNALPVERPSRYYLTVNLKTAKTLGLIDSGCG